MTPPLDALLKLPKRKRLELAEKLWLSVADERNLTVPVAHKRILDERIAQYQRGESKPIPHAEMMRKLRCK